MTEWRSDAGAAAATTVVAMTMTMVMAARGPWMSCVEKGRRIELIVQFELLFSIVTMVSVTPSARCLHTRCMPMWWHHTFVTKSFSVDICYYSECDRFPLVWTKYDVCSGAQPTLIYGLNIIKLAWKEREPTGSHNVLHILSVLRVYMCRSMSGCLCAKSIDAMWFANSSYTELN